MLCANFLNVRKCMSGCARACTTQVKCTTCHSHPYPLPFQASSCRLDRRNRLRIYIAIVLQHIMHRRLLASRSHTTASRMHTPLHTWSDTAIAVLAHIVPHAGRWFAKRVSRCCKEHLTCEADGCTVRWRIQSKACATVLHTAYLASCR
jgi:hypothetical protein